MPPPLPPSKAHGEKPCDASGSHGGGGGGGASAAAGAREGKKTLMVGQQYLRPLMRALNSAT
jgi:hypothetical protein